MKNTNAVLFCMLFAFSSCTRTRDKLSSLVTEVTQSPDRKELVNEKGTTVQKRFNLPAGYKRTAVTQNSFAYYLRNLPLKEAGSKVKYYNGESKDNLVYSAVVNMDIGNRNLQQCADAVIRLRGEYFFSQKAYDKITFNFTNGFEAKYSEWIKGNRINVSGNKVSWQKSAQPSNTYKDFRNFMDIVFSYAGTLSLAKSLKPKDIKDILAGDVFIRGGSPGHAVIVVDVAENKAGEKVFLLAQSYMPAQETQILKNFNDNKLSPWYSSTVTGELVTPQWTFSLDQLKTWE
jgi:Domain of unknown function (4846)